jgi:hypothetical protein
MNDGCLFNRARLESDQVYEKWTESKNGVWQIRILEASLKLNGYEIHLLR